MIQWLRKTWLPGIRVQLMLWYTLVFTLLLLLFSSILYTTLQASLASGVDSALQLRALQIASGISNDGGKLTIQDVTGELPELYITDAQQVSNTIGQSSTASDVNIGTLVRILDTKAETFYISPAFHALTLPSASVTLPLRGISWQDTVIAHNGQAVRLYSMALTDNGIVFGVLQVGESLARLDATLRSIIIALLVVTPFVLFLSAFGSYWLAKRAFRPIHRLTRAARDIKAGDLHQRVPVPQPKDEVHDLALTLNEMIGRLDRAFKQQRRFVADASHELRTPVSVIRTVTDLALEEPLGSEEYVSVLRDVNIEAERLGHLINDLLILARADEGQIQLDCEPVRLDLLAFDVAATLEPLAIERSITLQIQELEPVSVLGDTARLIQMMMGLVDNALTYTNAGGSVAINVQVHSANACFSVRDTGIGIAPEDVPHIFERFYRADTARSRITGGSGLGLAIVDWVARTHNGSIAVESQLGHGSTFKVTLPVASAILAQEDDQRVCQLLPL